MSKLFSSTIKFSSRLRASAQHFEEQMLRRGSGDGKSQLIDLSKVQVVDYYKRGLGLSAVHSLAAEEDVLHIPFQTYAQYSAIFASEDMKRSTPRLFEQISTMTNGNSNLLGSICLALSMMNRIENDPYLRFLFDIGQEQANLHPLTFPNDDHEYLRALKGTVPGRKISLHRRIYHTVASALFGKSSSNNLSFSSHDSDPKSIFLWAVSIIQSRGLKCGSNTFSLCPIIDFANHSSEENVKYLLDGTSFVLRTTQIIEAGEEIKLNYGPSSDEARFASLYGFFTNHPSPNNETVEIAWPSSTNTSINRVVEWQNSNGFAKNISLNIANIIRHESAREPTTVSVLAPILAQARMSKMTDDLLKKLQEKGLGNPLFVMSRTNETFAVDYTIEVLEREIASRQSILKDFRGFDENDPWLEGANNVGRRELKAIMQLMQLTQEYQKTF